MTSISFRSICAVIVLFAVSNVAGAQRPKRGDAGASNKSVPGAHYDACKLVSIADVTPILGDGATQTLANGGQNCEFVSANKKHKLFVRTPESTRTEPEVTLKHFREGPHHNYTMGEAKDLGDEGVTAITPMGVEIMAIKQHRILYIQDYAGYGSKGSAEQLSKLLPIARKAAAVF